MSKASFSFVDNSNINDVKETADNAQTAADEAQETADAAKGIASETAQHFWFKSSGSDTGAHISEQTQAEFEADPSGGNLLANSNGVAVRDGTTELATFTAEGLKVNQGGSEVASFGATARIGKPTSANEGNVLIDSDSVDIRKGADVLATFGSDGLRIGKNDEKHIEVASGSFVVCDEDNGHPFFISTEDSRITRGYEHRWKVGKTGSGHSSYSKNIFLKGELVDNKLYFATSTSGAPTSFTRYIIPTTTTQSITINGVTFSAWYKQNGVLFVAILNTSSTTDYYAALKYSVSFLDPIIQIDDANYRLESTSYVPLVDAEGTSGLCNITRYGKLAMIELYVWKANVRSMNTIYRGTLLDFVPAFGTISLTGYYGGPIIGSLQESGELSIVNAGPATINPSSTSPVIVYGTYIYK